MKTLLSAVALLGILLAPALSLAAGFVASAPLALHWDGSAWSVVPTPALGNNGFFSAVQALSSKNAIAVGQTGSQGLIERWNSHTWSQYPAPPAEPIGYLFGISSRRGATWIAGRQGFEETDELFLQFVR